MHPPFGRQRTFSAFLLLVLFMHIVQFTAGQPHGYVMVCILAIGCCWVVRRSFEGIAVQCLTCPTGLVSNIALLTGDPICDFPLFSSRVSDYFTFVFSSHRALVSTGAGAPSQLSVDRAAAARRQRPVPASGAAHCERVRALSDGLPLPY